MRISRLVQQQQPSALFPRLTIERVRRWLAAGALSSEELCLYCHALAVAGEREWQLHAFERIATLDAILHQARESDNRRRQQRQQQHTKTVLSALDGIPVSIKANLAVASQPLTAGSRILGCSTSDGAPTSMATPNGNQPPTTATANIGYNAAVTESLLVHCGAVFMGCTTMDEFGMGSLGQSISTALKGDKRGGMSRNPLPLLQRRRSNSVSWNGFSDMTDEMALQAIRQSPDALVEAHANHLRTLEEETTDNDPIETSIYSAGGSSCGSAISIAHGSSLASLGSDTGGSVRLPAAWCGVVGVKPTYGLLSRHGLVSYASSLDTIGILAPSVSCATTVLDCLVSSSLDASVPHSPVVVRDSNQTAPPDTSTYLHALRTTARQQALDEATVESNESSPAPSSPSSRPLLSGIRVGIPAALSVSECPTAVTKAWSRAAAWLEQHGAVVEPISINRLDPAVLQQSLAAYYILVSAEASSNLSRYDGLRYGYSATAVAFAAAAAADATAMEGVAAAADNQVESYTATNSPTFSILEQKYAATRALGFGPEVIRRILCGTAVLSSDRFHSHYEGAAKLRAVLIQQLHNCFHGSSSEDTLTGDRNSRSSKADCFDLLLFPTTIFPPPKQSDRPNPTQVFANDVMTVPISLAGLPAISVPFGEWGHADAPFSIGLQLVAPRFGEGTLLRAAHVLERKATAMDK